MSTYMHKYIHTYLSLSLSLPRPPFSLSVYKSICANVHMRGVGGVSRPQRAEQVRILKNQLASQFAV